MTEINNSTPPSRFLPDPGHGIWRWVLALSLACNLLIGGAFIGHQWGRNPLDHPGAANYGLFVPRSFFAGIARERRQELGKTFRASKPDVEKLRNQTRQDATKVADALESSSFESASLNAVIDSFTTGDGSVAAKGGTVLKEFYAKLSPDERTALAKAIRAKTEQRN